MKEFRDFIKEAIQALFVTLVICYLLLNYVFMSIEVVGRSMEPNLYNGQKGLSFYITRKISINRFDIVVIDRETKEDLLVKRIIGLPGEKIEYKNSVLYIDGVKTEEDFLKEGTVTNDFVIELGEGEYCCLGDHREVSNDSRFYGAFTEDELICTHVLILNPIEESGFKK